ncbi:ATP-dependent nuclease [Tritonibacter scottomollicae]|uniref:AAA15 family ATPase/GTPase n=1 Tax=Tritonibacter scottomollicae TaxID=483013 RepID=A0A2T1ALP9_TRISK|nr:AAA family ATPase [Tritonibacter scottomollicae]PRZ49531.1 AAA15 family ATPase/GTPase [Tritonibacter scottomollicae]
MELIKEIEIRYFRSFYKFRLKDLGDLSIIFGKNDSGKSNVVRALNLFFAGRPEHSHPFDFPIDFCEQRLSESEVADDVRKFLYVKVTFNTPSSYRKSLGATFSIKRQWTVSRGADYNEEISRHIPKQKHYLVTRLLNKIKFIYIPAIKDLSIFEMLLASIHETISESADFTKAIGDFSNQLQKMTSEMFKGLPEEVSSSTKIGAPTQLSQLFQTLDFETLANGELTPKSLTRQRGDGVKVRHIPELLNFISEKDKFDFHIWGFEEPENSLDFVASQSEASRMLALAKGDRVQVIMTTHSPSFYLLDDPSVAKYYVSKNSKGLSTPTQGKDLKEFDAQSALQDGFYLPAVAEAVKQVAEIEARAKQAEEAATNLAQELAEITTPVVLTEGRTDAKILLLAWEKRRGGTPPFQIRSCETGGEQAGSGNGGAGSLALRVKAIAADHPNTVVALFDRDPEGIAAYKLDKNFVEFDVVGHKAKRGMHGKSYAALLPAPDFRDDCAAYQNLPIEFLFRDEHLGKSVDGKRLALKGKKASTMVGTQKVEKPLDDVTHFKDVGNGKTDFAEVIVPSFDAEAFDAFDQVFSIIEGLIAFEAARVD